MEEQRCRRQRYCNNNKHVSYLLYLFISKKVISICTYFRDRKQTQRCIPVISYFVFIRVILLESAAFPFNCLNKMNVTYAYL